MFPGGQQPVIHGENVYLRYPRIADFKSLGAIARRKQVVSHAVGAAWAQRMNLARARFAAGSNAIRARPAKIRLCIFRVSQRRQHAAGRVHPLQCAARRHPMLHAGLLGRRAFCAEGYTFDALRVLIPFIFPRSACIGSRPPVFPSTKRRKGCWRSPGFCKRGWPDVIFKSMASGRIMFSLLFSPRCSAGVTGATRTIRRIATTFAMLLALCACVVAHEFRRSRA